MKHFLRVFIAFYKRNKTITLLSVIGLSVGMLGVLILTVKLVNENSYNRDIENGNCVYRIISNMMGFKQPLTPILLGNILKSRLPEIDKYARFAKLDGLIGYIYGIKGEEKIDEPNFYTADNSFLKIMNIKSVNGLELHNIEPGYIALSEKTAIKYFGDKNVIGKDFSVLFKDKLYNFVIVDVFKDIPWNNTFRPELICNLNFYIDILTNIYGADKHKLTKTLEDDNIETIIVRNRNISEKKFKKKFSEVTKLLYSRIQRQTQLSLQNIFDVYLNSSEIKNDFISKGSKDNLFYYRLSILILMLITSFNYILLQTSISSQRHLEVGLKKVFGANKAQISIQFFIESFLITLIAVPIIIILYLLYAGFIESQMFTEARFYVDKLWLYAVILLGVITLIALISAMYIGLYISSLNPVTAVSGNDLVKNNKKIYLLILLGFQVFISLVLVTFSLTLYFQINYALNKSIGIEKDKLVLIYFESSISAADYHLLKNELLSLSNVSNVTGGVLLPPTNTASARPFVADNDNYTSIVCESYKVNSDFFKTFGISLVKGRSFNFTSLNDLENCIIINQKAASKYRFSNPIGEKIEDKTIIGVTNDFNFHALHKEIEPSIFFPNNKATRCLAIQCKSSINVESIYEIRNIVNNAYNGKMFNVSSFKSRLRELYVKDIGFRNFITFYACIVTIITLIGVIGITLYISKKERVNIIIRKVYGASKIEILRDFSAKLIISCFGASVFSIPLTLIMSNIWLKNYSYTINLSWTMYLNVILLFTFLVLVISFSVIFKTVSVSPTKYLK